MLLGTLRGERETKIAYYFTLCIHDYSVIDEIVQRTFKKRFKFQFYKTITKCVIEW